MGTKAVKKRNTRNKRQRPSERICSLADVMADAVYISTPDYQVEFVNKAFRSRWGDPAPNTPCYEAIYGQPSVCPWCVYSKVQAGETVRHALENPRDKRVYDVINSPLSNPDNTISKLSILHDLTDIKKAEKEMIKACRMRTLAETIVTVSHEINNPLQIIIGESDTLLKKEIPEDIKEALHIIGQMSERIKHSIKQMQHIKEARSTDYSGDITMIDIHGDKK